MRFSAQAWVSPRIFGASMRILFIPLMFLVACKPEITKAQFDQAMKAQKADIEKTNKSMKRVIRTQGETIRQLKTLLAEPLVNGVVSKLSAASGGAVAISNVTVASNAGRKIKIDGNASNKKKVSTFISALEKHPMIDKVYLVSVVDTKIGGEERQAFKITAKYVAVPVKKKGASSKKKGPVSKKDLAKKKALAKKKGPGSKGKKGAPVKKKANGAKPPAKAKANGKAKAN